MYRQGNENDYQDVLEKVQQKTFLFIGLAMVLFVEALSIDFYFLTQLRM